MTMLAILLTALSASCFYLSAKQQRLLASPWKQGRWLGYILLPATLGCWVVAQGSSAGVVGLLVVMMLALIILPAGSLLQRIGTR